MRRLRYCVAHTLTGRYTYSRESTLLELIKQLMPYLAALGSVVAFCFTVFKYLHTQKQVAQDKRFDQYIRVFEWVAGKTADGKFLVNTQQAMAVYQLSEFPEYREMTLPIINYYLEQTAGDSDISLFRGSLLYTKLKLEKYV